PPLPVTHPLEDAAERGCTRVPADSCRSVEPRSAHRDGEDTAIPMPHGLPRVAQSPPPVARPVRLVVPGVPGVQPLRAAHGDCVHGCGPEKRVDLWLRLAPDRAEPPSAAAPIQRGTG